MNHGNQKKLSKYLPIVMSKDITQARFEMTLWERRLIYVCLSKLSPEDQVFPLIHFSIAEMASLLDEKSFSNTDYASLRKAAKRLITRIIELDEDGKYKAYNWVSYFELDSKRNEIAMKFNDFMTPHLLNLLANKGYTKFLLKFSMPLSSIYGQRFYEMFRAMVYDGNTNAIQRVELDELRNRLSMPEGKYKNFNSFRVYVLDTAEREINQKTDIFISFKEIRSNARGKPVEALHVSVALKANMIHEWDRFMLWQKSDLLERIQQVSKRTKAQQIDIEVLLKYSHESIARLTFEISENKIDLLKIQNHQKFFEWTLQKWQEPLGFNQVSLDEVL